MMKYSACKPCLGFAVAMLVALTVPLLAADLKEDERLQLANGLYARDMHVLAIQEYQGFIKAFPNSTQADVARFRLANSLRRHGETDQAIAMFATVFRDYPKSAFRARAGFTLADLLQRADRHKEAIKTLQDLVALDVPEDMASSAWYALGVSLLATDQTAAARKTFDRVRRTYPDSTVFPFALLQLGNLYAEGGPKDVAEADALYAALAKDPPSDRLGAEALFQQAGMHFRRESYDKAAQLYQTLLDRYPQDKRTREALMFAAWSAHRAGLYAAALNLAETHAETAAAPAAAEWLYLKANSERQLLKYVEAAGTYRALLEAFPESAFADPARFELAVTLYRQSRFQEAIAAARTVTLTPAIAKDVYWLLAESTSALKQASEAVQYYRLIVEQFPDSTVAADAAYRLARHLQEADNNKEAARYYGMVVARWPQHRLAPTALFAAAATRARAGLHAEAIRDWAALVKAYPDDLLAEQALYHKAMNEIRLKRDADALQTLESLLKQFPKTGYLADLYTWRGLLLKEAGKASDAERMFRLALKSDPRDALKRDAAFHLATLLLAKPEKHHGEAADWLQSLVGTAAADKLAPAHWQWLAEFRFAEKAYEASLTAAQALADSAQNAALRQAGWTLAGRAAQAKGDRQAAQESFSAALQAKAQTPFRSEAAWRLGDLMLKDNRSAEALAHFTLAAETAADDEAGLAIRVRAYAGLGQAAEMMGRLEEAARYYMSVAILFEDPELVAECLDRAAAVFEALNQPERAAQALRERQERFPDPSLNPDTGSNSDMTTDEKIE